MNAIILEQNILASLDDQNLINIAKEIFKHPSYSTLLELNSILYNMLPSDKSAPLINQIINFMEDANCRYMIDNDSEGQRIINEYGEMFSNDPLNCDVIKYLTHRQVYTMIINRIYYGLVYPKLYFSILNVLKHVYGLILPVKYIKAAFMNIPFDIVKHAKSEEIKLCITNVTLEFLKTYDGNM